MKFKNYIINYKMISEGATLMEGAVAWDDLSLFYKKANKSTVDKMVELVKNEDWEAFKKLIYSIIGKKING
jgi:hypothetical protein